MESHRRFEELKGESMFATSIEDSGLLTNH